jgi:hypothetical protein
MQTTAARATRIAAIVAARRFDDRICRFDDAVHG